MVIMKRRKGIVFTLDVIASLVVLVAAVGVVSLLQHSAELPSVQYGNLNSIALDSVAVLEKSKVRDVEGLPIVRDLLQKGILLDEDRNKTVMDVVGSLWAQGNLTMAQNLTESMFKGYLPGKINYEIFMGDTLIYNSTPIANPRTKITASTAVSGYRTGVPTSGYLARAWVNAASGNEIKTIGISPFGSGYRTISAPARCTSGDGAWWRGTGGNLTLIKSFDIPQDAQNINGTFYIAVHDEGGMAYIWLNGILQNFSTWLTNPIYTSINVTGLRAGNNTLKMILTRPVLATYPHTHTHPGLMLEVRYTKEKLLDYVQEQEHYELVNLSYIEGSPAAWGIFSMNIPAGSIINQARVHIEAQDVKRYYEINVNDVTVDSQTFGAQQNVIVDLDIINDLHQTAGRNATGETNSLALYIDIRGQDDCPRPQAAGTVRLLNTSFFLLNYTLPTTVKKYGHMIFTNKLEFDRLDGQGEATTKRVDWNVSNTDIVSTYLHIAQLTACRIAAAAWHDPETAPTWSGAQDRWNPVSMQIFKSPNLRDVPDSIYVRTDRLAKNTTNHVIARDGFQEGTMNCAATNAILPNSTIEYTVLAPGVVGYGDVFNTSTEAADDALARLAALVAPYDLTYNAATESSNIAGISWLWSPTRLKVVVGS